MPQEDPSKPSEVQADSRFLLHATLGLLLGQQPSSRLSVAGLWGLGAQNLEEQNSKCRVHRLSLPSASGWCCVSCGMRRMKLMGRRMRVQHQRHGWGSRCCGVVAGRGFWVWGGLWGYGSASSRTLPVCSSLDSYRVPFQKPMPKHEPRRDSSVRMVGLYLPRRAATNPHKHVGVHWCETRTN